MCRESNTHLVLCSGSSWDPKGTPKHTSASAKVSTGKRSVCDSTETPSTLVCSAESKGLKVL